METSYAATSTGTSRQTIVVASADSPRTPEVEPIPRLFPTISTLPVVNNRLKWRGEMLPPISSDHIVKHWAIERVNYYGIVIPWRRKFGMVYAIGIRATDNFPCIIEELKSIFGLQLRGIARILVSQVSYLLYYLPISTQGQIIWEPSLRQYVKDRKVTTFPVDETTMAIRRIIVFSDLLALRKISESMIRLRPTVDQKIVFVSHNTASKSMTDTPIDTYQPTSILTKSIYTRWFGESCSYPECVRQMIVERYPGLDDPSLIQFLRTKIETAIRKYDPTKLWFSHHILSRVAQHLAISSSEVKI